MTFSPDGERLASCSGIGDRTVWVWDPASGQLLLTLTGPTAWVSGVAFSPDGNRLASGGSDYQLKVWEADRGQNAPVMPVVAAP